MEQPRQITLGATVPLSPGDAAEASADPPPTDADAPRLAREALDARLARFGHHRAEVAGGRYELRGLEGLGATSRVYRVFDRDLAREVAIKVLARSAPDDAEEIASFIDEARITAELQHPNVLPVYELDAGERGELFFSMKRIEGRSLGDALMAAADGRPDPRFAGAEGANAIVSVFIDVCQALSYAHHHGIVHQDVKPDNIMLGGFGEVLLVDWGSAVRIDEAEPRIYGTPLYMSPEQARRERPTPSSDVFCVGASLFHALTGRPPTAADSFEELVRRRGAGEIDAPTAVERALAPPALLHIALKAIALAPGDRYASADALLADLRAYQAGVAVSAYPEPPWRRAWRWYLLHRRACWAMAAAAAIVLCLAGELALELRKRQASWRLIDDEDLSLATPESLAKHWVGRVKLSDDSSARFRDEGFAGSTHWRFGDGALRLDGGDDYADLAWRGGLAGDFRVEWESAPEGCNLDLDCFIGADRESGYTFHVGSYGDPRRADLTRGPKYETCDQRLLDEPLRFGQLHAFALERSGQRLRLEMDGKTIFDYADVDPLSSLRGDAFGFDCFRDHQQRLRCVRVYERALPELVSPLEVAQALYRNGNPAAAASQYAELERAHPGTPLELTALASRGICLVRGVDPPAGKELLERFLKDHPDHELAALATVELEAEASSRHADAEAAELRERLKRFRGQPVLRRVLLEMDAAARRAFSARPVPEVGGNDFEPDRAERMLATVAELRRWGEAYGTSIAGLGFVTQAAGFLRRVGRFDDDFAVCPPGSKEYAKLLLAAGEYQRVVDQYGYLADLSAAARMELGRAEEVAADPTAFPEDRARALIALGRGDDAIARFPTTGASTELLLSRGRFDEFERLFAGHERDHGDGSLGVTPRARLLIARKQWDAVLAECEDPIARWNALVALGRFDEALPIHAGEPWAILQIVFHRFERGERDEAYALLRRLRGHQPQTDSEAECFNALMRDVWPIFFEGAPRDPAAAMAAPLAMDRRWFGGLLRHAAALIAGREDEAAFRAQPRRRGVESNLRFCLGLRADILGQREQAVAEYRASLALSAFMDNRTYMVWRLKELAPETPSP